MMKKIVLIPLGFILLLIASVSVFLLLKAHQVDAGRGEMNRLLDGTVFPKLLNVGTVENLTILPLIDYYTDDKNLATEAGVSYLVKADDRVILMDVGFNRDGVHPSPLLRNMKALNVDPGRIDMIFISHIHPDHVGGMAEMKKGEFSLSRGPVSLGKIPVYSPGPLIPSKWNPGPEVEIIAGPKVIAPGIVTLGVIPRYLYFFGKTDEQVLAINLKGRGIVLVVGCGHPTIERIIERTKMLFDRPIYAIVGGLHFPVKGGRSYMGPINVQYVVGADRAPWNGLDERDLDSAIGAIKKERVRALSLSPHDSSDWSMEKFMRAFANEWRFLKVGREIVL